VLGTWDDLTGDSADAVNTVWVVTESFLADNRSRIVEFLGHVQDSYDAFYADEDAWIATVEEVLPDANREFLPEIYAYYRDAEMYPINGTPPLTAEQWDGLDAFFRQLGEYDQTADPSMADFDLIAEVSSS